MVMHITVRRILAEALIDSSPDRDPGLPHTQTPMSPTHQNTHAHSHRAGLEVEFQGARQPPAALIPFTGTARLEISSLEVCG